MTEPIKVRYLEPIRFDNPPPDFNGDWSTLRGRSLWLTREQIALVYGEPPAMPIADERSARAVLALMDQGAQTINAIASVMREQQGHYVEDAMVRLVGRVVSARRMRLLRRRGCVIRFDGYTATGKKRYRWLPSAAVEWRPAADSSRETPQRCDEAT